LKQTDSAIEQMNKELEDFKQQAEISERLKNIFLNCISYEIRTPLTNILGFTELLENSLRGKLTSDEIGFFNNIQQSSNYLNLLLEDIMVISLILSDKLELLNERFDADASIKKLIKKIFLVEWNLDLRLIENFQAPKAQLYLDEKRFQQAILNILRNALKYTHEGTISITTDIDDENYIVIIEDTGIGIREEFIPYVFDLFRQGDDSLNRRYRGLGVGLAITYHLIKRMGGQIDVKSEVGQGSVIKLLLPIHSSQKMIIENDVDNVLVPETDIPIEKVLKKSTVLILDDDWANLQYTQFLINKLNIDFISAESGEKALELLVKKHIDGMLVDISLVSGMSGIEFLKRVKKQKKYADTPIIAVTAHSDKKQFLSEGFDDYLAKPFTLKDLQEVIFKNLTILS